MVALLEQPPPEARPYSPRGAAERLFYCRDPEICIHGPAGTGKSRGAYEKLHLCAMKYPGMRGLVLRKTRASVTQSSLVTMEEEVFRVGDPIKSGSGRANRQSYKYPNGSEIVIGGLDNPDRVMSTRYDMALFEEAIECDVSDWEKVNTRLRQAEVFTMPYRQAIAMCNPGPAAHWLRLKMDDGSITEFASLYEDNPVYWDRIAGDWTDAGREYIAKLDRLTGVRYQRLRLGLWVAAEGQIWPNFNPKLHIIDAWTDKADPIMWHFASVDWGFDRPGVIQVWGVTHRRRAVLVREVYRSEENTNWWAEAAVRLQNQYGIRSYVCDPSKPEAIDIFNRRLHQVEDRNCAIQGINAFEAGANVVRDRLAVRPDGQPGVFFLRDALDQVDERMVAEKSATKTVDEIGDYTFREIKPGQRTKEEPAPGLDDHGCDAMRYGMMYLDASIYSVSIEKPPPDPDTFEGRFNVEATLAKSRMRKVSNR